MQCARCSGLMVWIGPLANETASSPQDENSWRCVNCGELLDAQILANRSTPPEQREVSRRRWRLPLSSRVSR
ncbi:MAG: hypothetical protein AB1555_06790 [Nitrospirota bacterium]